MTHVITFSSEGVWTKCCVVFRLLLMAIFGEYLVSCQSEFIPPFKLRTRRLNVPEVHGITASVKIHRWTNKKTTNLALANDSWFNFYFVISFIE